MSKLKGNSGKAQMWALRIFILACVIFLALKYFKVIGG
jgi:hypothetical protein